ncbi:alpha/beta hydrolase [Rhodocytophaga rosea]|uniref:Alpha/beta hydrolase n=2 Tax=Rhodocytophaga rosea TaxID=2704465 RepID=A0A6C0GX60_9BACT|nr:alpha/beta hydrolase [Rhodocytophaga rosea]
MIIVTGIAIVSKAQTAQPLSITLENFEYPYPTQYIQFAAENQDLKMAYMDVKPSGQSNGKTILLFHGKNFGGYYWKNVIQALSQQGFRIVVPDQIGFGRSSKPDIHYSFHALASHTKALLDSLRITQTTIIGHSMGGMLATRFTLLFPQMVSHLILENPIGLEDYRIYVPYTPLDKSYAEELKTTEESIRKYHQFYYVQWKPEYEAYVQAMAGVKKSSEYPRYARAAALTSQMIYEQPVCYEFTYIQPPTLLIIGQEDRTVVGKAKVSKENLSKVGQYPALGKQTAKLIPKSTLIELPNVGHIPHLEASERFMQEILKFLK